MRIHAADIRAVSSGLAVMAGYAGITWVVVKVVERFGGTTELGVLLLPMASLFLVLAWMLGQLVRAPRP